MTACPKCGDSGILEVPIGKKVRLECLKCSRLMSWKSDTKPEAVPLSVKPAGTEVTFSEVPLETPSHWLYVSKKLDIQLVPNDLLWSAPGISFGLTGGPVTFYRLTARVFLWLQLAGEQLEAKCLSSGDLTDLHLFIAHMKPIWEFAERYIRVEAVRLARTQKITLPDAPDANDVKELIR